MVAPLRIVFIVFAALAGVGLAAAGAAGAWDLLDLTETAASITVPGYAYAPIIAVIVLFSGLAAFSRRWDVLSIVCWFLLGSAVSDALYSLWTLPSEGLLVGLPAIVAMVFPILGLTLASVAVRQGRNMTPVGSGWSHDLIRLRNTLAGLAALSYLWRGATLAWTPEAISVLAYFRGTAEAYLILSSVLGIACALLILGALAFLKASHRFLNALLAFTAGLALEGFLQAVDLVLNPGARLELVYALQDAMAFLACAAALAVSLAGERASSRLAA